MYASTSRRAPQCSQTSTSKPSPRFIASAHNRRRRVRPRGNSGGSFAATGCRAVAVPGSSSGAGTTHSQRGPGRACTAGLVGSRRRQQPVARHQVEPRSRRQRRQPREQRAWRVAASTSLAAFEEAAAVRRRQGQRAHLHRHRAVAPLLLEGVPHLPRRRHRQTLDHERRRVSRVPELYVVAGVGVANGVAATVDMGRLVTAVSPAP